VKKILVVDDQAIIRQLLEISLRREDRQVLLAESGERAVQLAQEQRFDLIIVDLMMPGGMDGFETIEYLQQNAAESLCPFMILTAKDQQPERDRAAILGVYHYLVKPFKLDDLFATVDNLLGAG
jgi:two-component system response regulator MprA